MKKLLVLLGLMFALCAPTLNADAMFFTNIGPKSYVSPGYGGSYSKNYCEISTATGKRAVFVLQDNILRLKSPDGSIEYLSLVPEDTSISTDFSISKVTAKMPDKEFWIVIASVGAHAKNSGFWIVGETGNTFAKYITTESLVNMGYTANKWHRLGCSIKDSYLVISSTHEELAPGLPSYKATVATDLQLVAFWDDNAKWFGLRRYQR